MKALGLSFGRKMKNSEILVKQVLKRMEERGYETQFIRMLDLDIKDCSGCSACVGNLLGGGAGKCVLKDDFPIVEEAILEADALVVCAPIYVWAPSGLFKTICDRMGPSHDLAFRVNAVETAKAMGKEPAVDPRAFKRRAAAYLTVGGARTKNWTSLGLAQMYEIGSMGLDVVDAVNVYATMDYQHVIGDEKAMARMTAVGDHLADALETEGGLDKWYGDEGVCPVCHMDLLTILPEGNKVECPVCGIEGELNLIDGKISVEFSEAQQKRSRVNYDGKYEHYVEIRDSVASMQMIPDLAERLKAYE